MKRFSVIALLLAVCLMSTGCRPNISRMISRSAINQQIRQDQQNRQVRPRVRTRPRVERPNRTRVRDQVRTRRSSW
ncbi:MAG: hypothetical protein ACR2NP_00500 [Pirellulaceae bacterium]